MNFRHNGQTLRGTPKEILQQIKEDAPKEYEFRYAGSIYIGTESDIKRELLHDLQVAPMSVNRGSIALKEETSPYDSNVIRLELMSKALCRVELHCLESKNAIS